MRAYRPPVDLKNPPIFGWWRRLGAGVHPRQRVGVDAVLLEPPQALVNDDHAVLAALETRCFGAQKAPWTMIQKVPDASDVEAIKDMVRKKMASSGK